MKTANKSKKPNVHGVSGTHIYHNKISCMGSLNFCSMLLHYRLLASIVILVVGLPYGSRGEPQQYPDAYSSFPTILGIGPAPASEFVCYHSSSNEYLVVPQEAVCNGVYDCPNGEDEANCMQAGSANVWNSNVVSGGGGVGDYVNAAMMNGDGGDPFYYDTSYVDYAQSSPQQTLESAPSEEIPDGFVRLPDNLQQKEYYYGEGGEQIGKYTESRTTNTIQPNEEQLN
jgi:hypothetical protein